MLSGVGKPQISGSYCMKMGYQKGKLYEFERRGIFDGMITEDVVCICIISKAGSEM